LNKFALKRQSVEDKVDLIQTLLKIEIRLIDLSFNFIDELLFMLESIDSKNSQVKKLANIIEAKCVDYSNTLKTDKEFTKLTKILEKHCANDKLFQYFK
jgi:hypothetical protein